MTIPKSASSKQYDRYNTERSHPFKLPTKLSEISEEFMIIFSNEVDIFESYSFDRILKEKQIFEEIFQ